MVKTQPGYKELALHGELDERLESLTALLSPCKLCPRECGVDRLGDEKGFCGVGKDLRISGAHAHFGEEAPLVGKHGSGTIFLTGCNLRCIYCQNYDISHLGVGENITVSDLAKQMLKLQNRGCHNINFVTPTHYIPQLVSAIIEAEKDGLEIPIVYNSGGYEKIETLKFLDGIIDIYMPDMKYGRSTEGELYSKAKDYPEICFNAVSEMHNQVGDLALDKNGIAYRGLLVRHLILPNDISGSEEIFKFLAENISRNTYINIMDQYRPEYKARDHRELIRAPSKKEYDSAVELASRFGLTHGEMYRHSSIFEFIKMLRE